MRPNAERFGESFRLAQLEPPPGEAYAQFSESAVRENPSIESVRIDWTEGLS